MTNLPEVVRLRPYAHRFISHDPRDALIQSLYRAQALARLMGELLGCGDEARIDAQDMAMSLDALACELRDAEGLAELIADVQRHVAQPTTRGTHR